MTSTSQDVRYRTIAALSAAGAATAALPAQTAPDEVSAILALTEVHTAAMQAFSASCNPHEDAGSELDRLNRADRILIKVSPTKSFELGALEMPKEIEFEYAQRRKALDAMTKG